VINGAVPYLSNQPSLKQAPSVYWLRKNYFLSNEANNGGGLVVYNVPVCMQNNVFSGNRAQSHGGAIIARRDYTLPSRYMIVMVNNSFYDNSAIYGAPCIPSGVKQIL